MWNYHIVLFDLNSVISDVLYNGPPSLALALSVFPLMVFLFWLCWKKNLFPVVDAVKF